MLFTWKPLEKPISTFLKFYLLIYSIINPLYAEQWNRLVEAREAIARMNPYRAVKSMKGIAMEKYHAMEHPYPSKIHLIEKFGYDGKQTHHLMRVDDYLERYIAGEPYKDCLRPTASKLPRLMEYKEHKIPLEEARIEAKIILDHTVQIADDFCSKLEDKENPEMRELLRDVSYNIMKISVKEELFT